MSDAQDKFSTRALDEQRGWVIDRCRSDGTTEQLVGVYVSEDFALRWIATLADAMQDIVAPPTD